MDYVDIYLLHRDDPDIPIGEIVDALNEQQRAGRVRSFGGSNWSHERIATANAYAHAKGLTPFAASSPQFSLVAPKEEIWEGCVSLGGEAGATARGWYAESGMPVFCWSSLARGFLSGAFSTEELEAMPETGEAMIRCFRSRDNLERYRRACALATHQGASLPQVALAWVLSQPVNSFALVGCQTPKEFEMNAGAFNIKMTPEDAAYLAG
jgi:aryl-alcohol dehydrogenase-like predicted oxidoreductase